jgi:hypothetical protein
VAYDEDLADRIRELIDDEPDLTDRWMFGGRPRPVAPGSTRVPRQGVTCG